MLRATVILLILTLCGTACAADTKPTERSIKELMRITMVSGFDNLTSPVIL